MQKVVGMGLERVSAFWMEEGERGGHWSVLHHFSDQSGFHPDV